MDKASLQDPFLSVACKQRVPVVVHLLDGTTLQGEIDSFDQFVLMLKTPNPQLIYKRHVFTIVPLRDIRRHLRQLRDPAPAQE